MFTKSILFFLCVFATSGYSQFHELGLFLGGSNYIGDIGFSVKGYKRIFFKERKVMQITIRFLKHLVA